MSQKRSRTRTHNFSSMKPGRPTPSPWKQLMLNRTISLPQACRSSSVSATFSMDSTTLTKSLCYPTCEHTASVGTTQDFLRSWKKVSRRLLVLFPAWISHLLFVTFLQSLKKKTTTSVTGKKTPAALATKQPTDVIGVKRASGELGEGPSMKKPTIAPKAAGGKNVSVPQKGPTKKTLKLTGGSRKLKAPK
ncbi:uncharacterized protein LOC116123313 isoform X1 [Pistacia vera]|uniref:uncharacterized protein LOC116123313 isoform X1 n=1 Tax=Pistacia vera TaxID=55513 RepID=UPI0012635B95|nr:uncharacterized protein LOC116123313 isoform X1 [Pistacia vera]